MTPKEGARQLGYIVEEMTYEIMQKAAEASVEGEKILMKHAQAVLGKPYGGKPSRPGQPPKYRTQRLRKNWQPATKFESSGSRLRITIAIKSNTPYFKFLEDGTSKMQKRPMRRRIRMRAKKEIAALYEAI